MKGIVRWALRIMAVAVIGLLSVAVAVSVRPLIAVLDKVDEAESFETYPPLVIEALLAAEDPDFLETSRLASLWGVLSFKSPSLTSHLVRSLFYRVHPERAVITEALVYIEIELSQSRERILSASLSHVSLASTPNGPIEGFKAAAMHYTGKAPENLSVAECALLAGLVKGPGYYSPARNPERARDRRNVVLQKLRDRGSINDAQYQEATESPLPAWGPTSGSRRRSALRAARA